MELLQLRYFYESALTENFTRTAETHLVPASAVSISVKKLEKELGCELFDRENNKIRLNRNGEILKKHLSKMFSELDEAMLSLNRTDCESADNDVYLSILTDRRVITDKIIEYKKLHPEVNFRITHAYNEKVRTDIIINEDSEKYVSYGRKKLLTEQLCFAVGKDFFCDNKIKSFSDLAALPFVIMDKNSSLGRLTLRIFEDRGIKPNIAIECDIPEYICRYVELGYGVTLFPTRSWNDFITENTRLLDISDFTMERSAFVYYNPRNMTPAVSGFINYLTDVII